MTTPKKEEAQQQQQAFTLGNFATIVGLVSIFVGGTVAYASNMTELATLKEKFGIEAPKNEEARKDIAAMKASYKVTLEEINRRLANIEAHLEKGR